MKYRVENHHMIVEYLKKNNLIVRVNITKKQNNTACVGIEKPDM